MHNGKFYVSTGNIPKGKVLCQALRSVPDRNAMNISLLSPIDYNTVLLYIRGRFYAN